MTTAFEKYSDILFSAYQHTAKSAELVAKKKEILDDIIHHYDFDVSSILFVGFSPCIKSYTDLNITVTEIGVSARQYLGNSVACVDISAIGNQKFDMVVATDEYLTYAATDYDQQQLIKQLAGFTKKCLVTTLRDYKNLDFKNREFSQPIMLRNVQDRKIYLEYYDYGSDDRNHFTATNYIFDNDSMEVIGPFSRRNLYFKQLAKFSLDAGAVNFLVHKNLMHKSIIKKSYEHIITIRF